MIKLCQNKNKNKNLFDALKFRLKQETEQKPHKQSLAINCKNNENAKDSSDGLNESNIQYNGPFKNESSLKNDAFKKMNFKIYFLNYIQNLL